MIIERVKIGGRKQRLATTMMMAAMAFGIVGIAWPGAFPGGARAATALDAMATLATIGADTMKLQLYCAASADLFAAAPDQTEAMAEKFDATIRAFGEGYAAALDLHYELDDASPEGAAMVEQFGKLDAQCAK